MASKFFHVQHEFRIGKSETWWETAQLAMAHGGGWDEAVAKNLEAGFFNHSFCPIGPEVLHSVSGKSAKESVPKSFRSSSMVQWV